MSGITHLEQLEDSRRPDSNRDGHRFGLEGNQLWEHVRFDLPRKRSVVSAFEPDLPTGQHSSNCLNLR